MNTKDKLIQLIKSSDGWVSGETLSEQLGVSRAAIGKHIASLRDEEYLIESATKRGYLLKIIPDEIDIEQIKNSLKTKRIGQKNWCLIKETSSTNHEAILWAAQGAPDGSIIITQRQTNGRGRKGKIWFSPPRSIYFSVILRPDISAEKLPQFSIMANFAVEKTLSEFGTFDVRIKYPNDIFVNDKKIAGTLVETGFIADEVEWIVIGIGININTEYSEFPSEIQDKSTSIFQENKEISSRNSIYVRLIEWLDYYYQLIIDEKLF